MFLASLAANEIGETQASLLLHGTMHEPKGKTWLTDHVRS
jgi:hypothetical protein